MILDRIVQNNEYICYMKFRGVSPYDILDLLVTH